MGKKKKSPVRLVVQIFFFLLVGLIAASHGLEEAGISIPLLSGASLHAVCPFGGVESLYQYITTGTFTKKIHESSMILMWIVLGLAVFFGPVFCGWICPLGAIQEWIGKLGKRIFGKRYNRIIPRSIDRWLRFLRYGVLGVVLYQTARSGVLLFEDVDPYYALFQFWTGEVAISAFVVLAVVLLSSLFIERPFCKYACPYGAVLGVTNLFRIFGIKRNKTSCISCNACTRECPMNIDVANARTVRNHQCISCLECTSEKACPVENTVELAVGKLETSLAAQYIEKGVKQ